jgi:uroporphyrinogen decarboxylase
LRSDIERSDPEHRLAYRAGITVSGNPLERYTWMTGLEQTLVNLLINPEVVHESMRRINDFFLGMMERVVDAVGDYIDIFYFADDLGGQTSLLMSRETYRDVIQPYHTELTRRSEELLPESKAMFHTDGAVFEIIPDLLDAGVEILEAVQTDAAGMDPARLKSTFGEKLIFHGGIPVQSLLPNEDEETVRARCDELVEVFGNGGGYIAAPTHAIQHGTPPENVMAMLESVLGHDDFVADLERARLG